jgi:hypothetical protein
MDEKELETWLKIQEIEEEKRYVLKYTFNNNITVWYEQNTNQIYVRGVDIREKEFFIADNLVTFLGNLTKQIKKYPTLIVLKDVLKKNFLKEIGVLYQ